MLYVVSGPSGAGKGTVIREVLSRRPDILLSVSTTTRPARPGERHGIDYIFISKGEFDAMRDRGELLESAKVYDNYYGTPRGPVEAAITAGRTVICELDIQGALAVKRAKPEAVLIFIEPPSFEDLERRLAGRASDQPDQIERRLAAAGEFDHRVVNDDLQRALQELVDLAARMCEP